MIEMGWHAQNEFNEEIERHKIAEQKHKERMREISDKHKAVVQEAGFVPGTYVSFSKFAAHESNLNLGVGIIEREDPVGVLDARFGKHSDQPAKISVRVRLLRVSDLTISKSISAWVNIIEHEVAIISESEFSERIEKLKMARSKQ